MPLLVGIELTDLNFIFDFGEYAFEIKTFTMCKIKALFVTWTFQKLWPDFHRTSTPKLGRDTAGFCYDRSQDI